MNFRLHIDYNKHEMIKIGNQTKKNCKYYRKCSDNFSADCMTLSACSFLAGWQGAENTCSILFCCKSCFKLVKHLLLSLTEKNDNPQRAKECEASKL